jgi:hypothetical protein
MLVPHPPPLFLPLPTILTLITVAVTTTDSGRTSTIGAVPTGTTGIIDRRWLWLREVFDVEVAADSLLELRVIVGIDGYRLQTTFHISYCIL